MLVDHTLSMKTTKFMSLENLYKYGNRSLELNCSSCINAVLLLTISLMILVLCMCIMVNFIIFVIFTNQVHPPVVGAHLFYRDCFPKSICLRVCVCVSGINN